MTQPTAIIINPASGGGRAMRRWSRIESRVREMLPGAEVVVARDPNDTVASTARLVRAGVRRVVAAGGDGTVNAVLQALMARDDAAGLALGAIGLGSSNDMHKPGTRTIDGIPVMVDFERAVPRDVGVIDIARGDGEERRYWLMNASVGVTARANAMYSRDPFIRRVKRGSIGMGMVCATLGSIATWRNRAIAIAGTMTSVTNLGVVKSPHVAGRLRYDSPFDPDSGMLDAHLASSPDRARLLLLLARLMRGRFSGAAGARSWQSTSIELAADEPFDVEFDGEIASTTRVRFGIRPRALAVCGHDTTVQREIERRRP